MQGSLFILLVAASLGPLRGPEEAATTFCLGRHQNALQRILMPAQTSG
ncbi:MAG TPA: hypothetical protein VKE41_01480 [Roseiflexaceae bacterium]|nr:hypothetical protein [Roseiflexaceae bacterium]